MDNRHMKHWMSVTEISTFCDRIALMTHCIFEFRKDWKRNNTIITTNITQQHSTTQIFKLKSFGNDQLERMTLYASIFQLISNHSVAYVESHKSIHNSFVRFSVASTNTQMTHIPKSQTVAFQYRFTWRIRAKTRATNHKTGALDIKWAGVLFTFSHVGHETMMSERWTVNRNRLKCREYNVY